VAEPVSAEQFKAQSRSTKEERELFRRFADEFRSLGMALQAAQGAGDAMEAAFEDLAARLVARRGLPARDAQRLEARLNVLMERLLGVSMEAHALLDERGGNRDFEHLPWERATWPGLDRRQVRWITEAAPGAEGDRQP
jgi:hypothetical protein